MKVILASLLFCVVAALDDNTLQCTTNRAEIPTDFIDMKDNCVKSMKTQVQEELKASMQYLAMGAHFSRDVINRPGFAKMFFEAASEERDHAMKLISYLLMRGELTDSISRLIQPYLDADKTHWTSGVEALSDALKLEATVTNKIKNVIIQCENDNNFNDYHLVDYLTGDFLEEQYKGQREIAGKLSTLGKMAKDHGALGEFLFDKTLLA